MSEHAGPWRATFRDGPLAGPDHDRLFAVGPVWTEMWLTRRPMTGWFIVGGPWGAPVEPWPEQVHYRLAYFWEPADGTDAIAAYEQLADAAV